MSAIPVVHSDLCLDCEAVVEKQSDGRCPVCGGAGVMHLQTIVGPKAETLDRNEYLLEVR